MNENFDNNLNVISNLFIDTFIDSHVLGGLEGGFVYLEMDFVLRERDSMSSS